MPIVYVVAAAVGLPIVLLGQQADRAGHSSADSSRLVARAAGAALLFGGLTGFALSILSIHALIAAAAALATGAAAAYLRARIIQLTGGVAVVADDPSRADDGVALVVATVSDEAAGKIVVQSGEDRSYLRAEPFRGGSYDIGTAVVIVALRGDVALVAAPEEVGR